MLLTVLSLATFVASGLAQTTAPPTWAQLYYKQAPLNAGLDYGTPDGKHDDLAQPLPPNHKPKVKNFILVIPDGFGAASEVISPKSYLISGSWSRVLSMVNQLFLEQGDASRRNAHRECQDPC